MSSYSIRALVTGVGGDLGQGIVKSLRLLDEPVIIYGCDSNTESIAEAFVDDFFEVPVASDKAYLEILQDMCVKEKIDIVIPGSEPEIFALSQVGTPPKLPCGIPVICQDFDWLKKYRDKLECYRLLDGKVKLAEFADGEDPEEVERMLNNNTFPCVVKPRYSSGSKGIGIAADKEQLLELLEVTDKPIIQRYIDDKFGEYSVGVFSCADFTTSVAFRRELGPRGATWYADNFVQDSEVLKYANDIAEASGLRGSCNIQVRKSSCGVRLLEINPRFSSLVAARSACGFKDLEWSIHLALGRKIIHKKCNYRQIRFQRYLHEMIDFGNGYKCIAEWTPNLVEAK